MPENEGWLEMVELFLQRDWLYRVKPSRESIRGAELALFRQINGYGTIKSFLKGTNFKKAISGITSYERGLRTSSVGEYVTELGLPYEVEHFTGKKEAPRASIRQTISPGAETRQKFHFD
jgi:hypothetical protein